MSFRDVYKIQKAGGPDVVVLPMYFFGMPYDGEITLSEEHLALRWLPYKQADAIVSMPDQNTALWELHERLKRGNLKRGIPAWMQRPVSYTHLDVYKRQVFMGFYTLTPETYAALDATMYVAAFIVIMQAIGLSCVVGVFRGGGDTMFCMVLDIITMWALALPLGALGGFVWHLSIPVVFLFLRFDEVVKVFICLWRLKSGKWLNNVTRANPDTLLDC